MKIDNLWKRINAIVPNPQCMTIGDTIIKWDDDREQPTDQELLAVNIPEIEAWEQYYKKMAQSDVEDMPRVEEDFWAHIKKHHPGETVPDPVAKKILRKEAKRADKPE